MSTYNGEKYVAQQLDSILRQDYPDVEIYVRDDGSS
ncbi:MAG: glycosyltransferase, partial [Acutalibacteraceae bacterium]